MDRPYGEQISDLLKNALSVSGHDHGKGYDVCREDCKPRNEEAEHKVIKGFEVGVHKFHPYRSENEHSEDRNDSGEGGIAVRLNSV